MRKYLLFASSKPLIRAVMPCTLFAVEFNSCHDEIRLQTINERELKKRVQQMVQERTQQQIRHYASSSNLYSFDAHDTSSVHKYNIIGVSFPSSRFTSRVPVYKHETRILMELTSNLGGTSAASPPFRLGNPALCGSHP